MGDDIVRYAWHFIDADWRTSEDKLPVKVGEPLVHVGELVPCRSGLHASTRAIDALYYSRGPVVSLVECEGEFVDHGSPSDKFVCRKRTVVWGYDCTDELRTFARLAALEVLHLWPDAPAVVREFLETGNEDLRAAAWAAAWDAVRDAVRDAARDAAWDAVRDAVRDAARDAAWDAARDAAWAAARAAARDAARDMARDMAFEKSNQILESLLIDGAVSRGLVTP
jgi:hypothetical protein